MISFAGVHLICESFGHGYLGRGKSLRVVNSLIDGRCGTEDTCVLFGADLCPRE